MATVARLADVPDTALARPSLWTKFQMTVRMRAHQVAAHLSEVAVQAEKMLSDTPRGSEGRRILRRCCVMRGAHERWSDPEGRAWLDARYEALASVSI